MDIKLADALDISVDYLLGKECFGKYDKETVERLQEIHNLDDEVIHNFVFGRNNRSSISS
ncbi:MAG: hypothetical protein IPN29_19025 [Saprospiraceae bacterium]|nr:hypothetical protein [Saprospiraceae bacterium]